MVWCNQTLFNKQQWHQSQQRKLLTAFAKELFLAIEEVVKRDDWIFAHDGAPSH